MINIYNIYFKYLFNKILIIGILFSFTFINIILISSANTSSQLPEYLYDSDIIHYNYIYKSYFLISILNAFIISIISITYNYNSLNFDILYISRINKYKLYFIKLLIISFLFILLSFIEFININIIALIYFNEFKIDLIDLFNLFQIYLILLFEYALISLFQIIIPNMITSIIYLLFSIIIKIIINNETKLANIIYKIIPIIRYKEEITYQVGSFLVLIYILLLIIINSLIYYLKDIKC